MTLTVLPSSLERLKLRAELQVSILIVAAVSPPPYFFQNIQNMSNIFFEIGILSSGKMFINLDSWVRTNSLLFKLER